MPKHLSSDVNSSDFFNDIPRTCSQSSYPCTALNRGNSALFSCSSGIPSYGSNSSSAMSAAAAAAFLLQAATGGSMNSDTSVPSSIPMRRSSTSSLFDSSQTPFSSSVISAAAQQAALAAAAQAMGSSGSPNSKATSDLHAAVISLALAANPPLANQSDAYHYEQQNHVSRSSQSVSELLRLPERHPDLLAAHPSLASVIRRRSSTVLSNYVSDISQNDRTSESGSGSNVASGSHLAQNLASALEVFSSQHAAISDPLESQISPVAIGRQDLSPDQPSDNKVHYARELDPYQFSVGDQLSKYCRRFPPTSDPLLSHPGSFVSAYSGLSSELACSHAFKESPRSGSHQMHLSSHASLNRNDPSVGNSCLSPTPTSSVNEGAPVLCRSTSPLSGSSLSNTACSGFNVSPGPADSRSRNVFMDSHSDPHFMSRTQNLSHRGLLSSQDIKSEYSLSSDYKDEPNRKREQRLIKNREAARECRRKKKEYVKCLESRVSLLESQNQQLIEELQKVKALCFNELCGLGLNSSTAACAAAVLAAVTSIPGTYSAPSASIAATLKNSPPDPASHLPDHNLFTLSPADGGQSGSQLVPACRTRARRRSIVATSKVSDITGPSSSDSLSASNYGSDYAADTVCGDSHSLYTLSLGETIRKQNGAQSCSSTQRVTPTHQVVNVRVSPNIYDSISPSDEIYRQRNLSGSAQGFPESARTGAKRSELSAYPCDSPVTSDALSNQSPNCFLHPHFAAKRGCRNLSSSADDKTRYPSARCSGGSDSNAVPKSIIPSNTVADAAVILAAAAVMVAESESTESEPRISV